MTLSTRGKTTPVPEKLPIDSHVPAIVRAVRESRALVLVAQPGAGKTTRVPPALVDDGPVVLLQPRRVAARAAARRIAAERGWTIGDDVGWHVRFERRYSPRTRLLVATEGVLTARLQQDPLLSSFRTIVIDEFHERSIHADLALALARQAWLARNDLHILVMSATLDAEPVSAFLGGCPIIDVPGRLHSIDIGYAPDRTVTAAALDVLGRTGGDVLCFLPGAGEIDRAVADLRQHLTRDVAVHPLHGSLSSDEQDRALTPSSGRRIIVATNIAETSLTVPGVTAVVDSGLHKVARYDADRGIDSLDVERITADSANQRAGRAGRLAPGTVLRLWDERDRLRPHREPEIRRIDLAGPALDIIAWGGQPTTFQWFERPREDMLASALALLVRLGAVRDGTLTAIGEQIRHIPLHPRLARLLVAAGGARAAARACALLSERHYARPRRPTPSSSSDLLTALDDWGNVLPHVARVAEALERLTPAGGRRPRPELKEADLRRAVLAGYPDRVAQRREPGSPRLRLASGAGAALSADSGVRDAAFLVAVDVHAGAHANDPDARVQIASAVEREWLEPTHSDVEHRFDRATGHVRAFAIDFYDALVLNERNVSADPEVAVRMLTEAWLARGPGAEDERLIRRAGFAGCDLDAAGIVQLAACGARSLDDMHFGAAIPADILRTIDKNAPDSIQLPSGRRARLEYGDDGRVSVAAKLQELFGLADTPRIGKRGEPLVLELLAPNGRPVQVTRDLKSFWERTYPEVRKELRGRYPRHPWPDDPMAAQPTARAKKRV